MLISSLFDANRTWFQDFWLSDYASYKWEKINLPFYIKSIPELRHYQGTIILRKQLPDRLINSMRKKKNILFRSGGISKAADFYLNTHLLGSLMESEPCKGDTGSEFVSHLPFQVWEDGDNHILT